MKLVHPSEQLPSVSSAVPPSATGFAGRGGLSLASLAGAAAIVFVVLFWRLGVPTFWDPDEAHYAETTRELIVRGDWLAPFYNERPFFDKPIFFHQLQAAAMSVVGSNELGARLVPALAGLMLVLITGWLGAALIGADVGLVAALLLATSPALFALARYAILDTVFTMFLFGGVSLLAVAALRDRWRLQYPGYLLVAGAVITKGPLALVLCGLTMGLALAASASLRRRLLALRWMTGLAVILAISAPWFVYMYVRFGQDFVDGYILDENIRLYAANRFGRQPGVGFYFQVLAAGLLPWTGLLIGRLIDDVRALVARRTRDDVEVLLWVWTAAIVGFFSVSKFKLDHYVFPAAPALCLLCARAMHELYLERSPDNRAARVGMHLVGPLLVAIGAAAGYLLIVRLDLPAAAMVIPSAIVIGGALTAVRLNLHGGRAPRVPWLAVGTVTVALAGAIVFVMPALEERKVVPDVARWVAGHADPQARLASYRLNRWNTVFRFYVDRHVAELDSPEDAVALFRTAPVVYCVMLEPAFEEFVARGVPLRRVYLREGMWATSGRALWRLRLPPARFVVATTAPLSPGADVAVEGRVPGPAGLSR